MKSHESTFIMRWTYAEALYWTTAPHSTISTRRGDVRGDSERTARRVLGGAHPHHVKIEPCLQQARASSSTPAKRATPSAIREAVEATTGDA